MAGPRSAGGGGPFDLERVRKNWERALEPEASRPSEKLARTRAPRDPFVAAKEDMVRLRSLLRSELPDHAAALAPFVERLEQLIAQMDAASASPDADPAALREEFHFALRDLQDLLEVFAFVQR